jgi:hypothetical protein
MELQDLKWNRQLKMIDNWSYITNHSYVNLDIKEILLKFKGNKKIGKINKISTRAWNESKTSYY